jgi:uncharacterized ion transporter superfamily protein YfcC
MAGGLAAITCGAIALTIQYWMGPTHTIGGVNYADVWHLPLQIIGWVLVLGGMAALLQKTGVFMRLPSSKAAEA